MLFCIGGKIIIKGVKQIPKGPFGLRNEIEQNLILSCLDETSNQVHNWISNSVLQICYLNGRTLDSI